MHVSMLHENCRVSLLLPFLFASKWLCLVMLFDVDREAERETCCWDSWSIAFERLSLCHLFFPLSMFVENIFFWCHSSNTLESASKSPDLDVLYFVWREWKTTVFAVHHQRQFLFSEGITVIDHQWSPQRTLMSCKSNKYRKGAHYRRLGFWIMLSKGLRIFARAGLPLLAKASHCPKEEAALLIAGLMMYGRGFCRLLSLSSGVSSQASAGSSNDEEGRGWPNLDPGKRLPPNPVSMNLPLCLGWESSCLSP